MVILNKIECVVMLRSKYSFEEGSKLELNLKGTERPLKERKTTYGDGKVECFITAPDEPTNFFVRLFSEAYHAPGLAIVVCMIISARPCNMPYLTLCSDRRQVSMQPNLRKHSRAR